MKDFYAYLVCSAGIILSFNINSYYSEQMIDNTFDGKRFNFSSFTLLINYSFVFLAATIGKLLTGGRQFKHLFNKNLLMASLFSVVSLEATINIGYSLSFMFQVLFRSSKFLSIVVASLLFGDKHAHGLSAKNLIFAVMTTVGLLVFALGGKSGGESQVIGFVYAVISLISDCIVAQSQNTLKNDESFDFLTIMQTMNFWETILSAFLCLGFKGEFHPALHFIGRHPKIVSVLAMMTVSITVGNFFIFYHLKKFGPVSLAYTTSVRKVITIMITCVIVGKLLSGQQMVGIALILTCVLFDIYGVYVSSKEKKEKKQ